MRFQFDIEITPDEIKELIKSEMSDEEKEMFNNLNKLSEEIKKGASAPMNEASPEKTKVEESQGLLIGGKLYRLTPI